MEDKIIQISGISKRYRLGQIGTGTLQGDLKAWVERIRKRQPAEQTGGSILALDDVDLTVRRGEALGIIGRNGAGKSTLLKILCRITAPTAGTADIYGNITSMLEVGTGFDGELTGRENIYMNGAILGMSKAQINAKMDDIIAFSEIGEFIDTPVKRYSSGMYVKLGFAVAANLDSEIMIMDEVLAVGDMAFQHKCLDKMSEVVRSEGRTVLYVSHNMNTIRRFCTRCIVLDHGKLVYDGDVEKAISIYMGIDEADATEYVFDSTYRPYDQYIRLNKRFEMQSLRMIGVNRPVYTLSGDQPELELRYKAAARFSDVRLRLEFWSGSGEKIGTMISTEGFEVSEGSGTVRFRTLLEHLIPGQYRADLVVYQLDTDGNEDILDGVYPGLMLELREALDSTFRHSWNPQYLGYIRLEDLQIL